MRRLKSASGNCEYAMMIEIVDEMCCYALATVPVKYNFYADIKFFVH